MPTTADRRRTVSDLIDVTVRDHLPNKRHSRDNAKLETKLIWWKDAIGYVSPVTGYGAFDLRQAGGEALMPFTLNEYANPEDGVKDILATTVQRLEGVPAEDIARFRADVLPLGISDHEYDESHSRVWRQAISGTATNDGRQVAVTINRDWHTTEYAYSTGSVHSYVTEGAAAPRVNDEQMLQCRIVAACWAWLAARDEARRIATLYLESLLFQQFERPLIEADGVSKTQRKRAKAARKDAGIIDWAESARSDIQRAMRRKADRGEALKLIASNNRLSVRYVSELATGMGWKGTKGRPKKPKNRTAG